MVLPFGLSPDGEHNTMNINSAMRLPPGMAQQGKTTVSTVVPVIPSPYIDFIVVNREDRYMIRCDRKSVLESSVELAKLIHAGPNSGRKGDNHFQVQNVDKYDFELMIRFFEQKFIKYRDHLHIIKILELAERFNCPDLAIHCIRELDLQLSSATVIDIYRALWYYQGIQPPNQHFGPYVAKTGKSNEHKKTTNARTSGNETSKRLIPFTPEEYGSALLHNTLQLIEMQAELVLATPQLTELRFEELELIVKRDALQLSTELELFKCLSHWSYAECRRRNLDLTDENRCKVLGPLCLVPRYLLMTAAEFSSACKNLECLNRSESLLIREALDGKKLKNLSPEQTALFERFRTPRPEFPKMPIHLSDRSHPRNYPKKMRQAEKKSRSGGCFDNFGLNCLAVFACIFD